MNNDSTWFAGELYDDFNYQAFWKSRKYENNSGKNALRTLIDKISLTSKKELIDVGAGYGRLAEVYGNKFKHSTLIDPSIKNLKIAERKLGTKNFTYIDSIGSRLPFEDESFDVAIFVRVIHHLENPKIVLEEINRILKSNGWLILEFANKQHFKSAFINPASLFNFKPIDISDEDSSLPFKNYHPKWIKSLLSGVGFDIVEKLSVSNFRNPLVKKIIPDKILLSIEGVIQKPLGYFNFGPSIYVLARKTTP